MNDNIFKQIMEILNYKNNIGKKDRLIIKTFIREILQEKTRLEENRDKALKYMKLHDLSHMSSEMTLENIIRGE